MRSSSSPKKRTALLLLAALPTAPACFSEPGYAFADASTGTPREASTSTANAQTGTPHSTTSGVEDAGSAASGSETTTSGSSSSGDADPGTTAASSPIVPLDQVAPGVLMFSEIMWNPSCVADNCEWIELFNASSDTISLQSLIVEDADGRQGAVIDPVVIEPYGFVVLARTERDWPYAFAQSGTYGPGPLLNNDQRELLIIRSGELELDRTPTFPLTASQGVSWGLRPAYMTPEGNDQPEHWCFSGTAIEDTNEFGSPHGFTISCAPSD